MTQLSVQLGGKALWRGLFLNAVLVGSSVYAERFSTPELAAHGLALKFGSSSPLSSTASPMQARRSVAS